MGRFQDSMKRFWETLSTEDVEEAQEYRFDGELATAMQVQEKQEKSHASLVSSLHHEDSKPKDDLRTVNGVNNIKVEARKDRVNAQEIEDSRDR